MSFLIFKTTVSPFELQKIRELTSSGTGLSSEKSLTQYSYNTHNLVECRAVRMNPAIYDTLFQLRISNACELQTEGESGPDRITRYTYDARWDKVSTEKRAVGVVGLEQYYARYSYTNAGEVFSVKDANNNLYQGETDEFGRLNKWKYPEKGAISNDFSGSSAASSSDY